MKVDAHQHFWLYSKEEYDWIGENENVIKRDFLPQHLLPLLNFNNLDACVAVQARQTKQETDWLIYLAQEFDFIKGVVGWIDLKADDLQQQLLPYKNNHKLKGFRHVLQGESDPMFMLNEKFINGLNTLAKHYYVYDLLIFAHQLPQSLLLIEKLPHLPIVIDHIAKPNIFTGKGFQQWQKYMQAIAEYPNVYCKVSGMVTEADVNNWQKEDFERYLAVVFEAFSPQRVMYGSDWPVCLLGGDYAEIKAIVESFVSTHYPEYEAQIFGGNAIKFYRL